MSLMQFQESLPSLQARGHSLTTQTRFCPFFRPPVDICEGIYLLFIMSNLHTVDIFTATYLPHLVNVVCERPPSLLAFVSNFNEHCNSKKGTHRTSHIWLMIQVPSQTLANIGNLEMPGNPFSTIGSNEISPLPEGNSLV